MVKGRPVFGVLYLPQMLLFGRVSSKLQVKDGTKNLSCSLVLSCRNVKSVS